MNSLIVAIPFLLLGGAALNGWLTLRKTRGSVVADRTISWLACAPPAAAFVCSLLVFFNLDGRHITVEGHEWIAIGDFKVSMSLAVDNLTAIMLLVVTGIGTLIHVYSTGYMKGDPGYSRYFTYLNLFMFFMLVLILAENMLLLFVGWEGVGLCSYLLIGFWWTDLDKAKAGMKAFLVNRIGDAGFLLGMILIYQTAGTLSFARLREIATSHPEIFTAGSGFFGVTLATASCLLLFLGATGKSAQFPLYVWLPDAMAGPTPVSALIHAATMVTAGVYVVGRTNFLFHLSPTAQIIVSLVGALTAFFAATIAVTQNDIKKVLAYSTVSQLGYMFIAVGLGAVSAAIFHVVTHAFFKACLFLGSGSVIHAMGGEQDMRKMGGLKKKMPITFGTMSVAAIAMAGIPPLAGFFSKDEILWTAFSSDVGTNWLLWLLGVGAAVCTAFYMGRLILMTFTGSCRADEHTRHHLHESPRSMTTVLVILAVGAALIGFFGVPHFLGGHNHFGQFVNHAVALPKTGEPAHHAVAVELALALFSVMIAVTGLAGAWLCYAKDPQIPDEYARKHADLYALIHDKYRVDEFYADTVVRPLERLGANSFFRIIDRRLIDNSIDALARGTGRFAEWVTTFQTGGVRLYVAVMIGGVLLVMLSLLS